MRGDEVRLSVPKKKERDENAGLQTERQIELYRQREKAKRERAERREAEAHAREAEAKVRHLNLGLVERAVALVFVVAVATALLMGVLHDPELLKFAIGAGGLGGVIGAILRQWSSKHPTGPAGT